MESVSLIDSFSEFASRKKIDRPTMIRILEDVFRTVIRKKYRSDENIDIIINIEKGDLEIWRYRQIVEDDAEIVDKNMQIKLSEARKFEEDLEVGEDFAEIVTIESFGRRLVQTARQTLIQKVRDLEKDLLFQKYKDLVGDIVTCEVYQTLRRETILIDAEGKELSLPYSEKIRKDHFHKGDMVRAIVHRVEFQNNNPRILLSRTSPLFLAKLFELEIPEVADGIITVKKVVRDPGERAKVAVESYDDRIDPVGACVGMKGSRIHAIVRELKNENIDVINYTANLELLIARALSPAKVTNVQLDDEDRRAIVTLKRDQISLAIGKGGQNIRLASDLVGLEIDVFREEALEEYEEDIDLDEFKDVIEDWVVDEFRRVGLDTAKAVLDYSREDLLVRVDLEEETIDFVLETIKREFEENESEAEPEG
ncbi:MAG: transcription termination/antitermination protein NusA [Bernardetiaceae bacterium]|nr:transcription termination/antitermination protein NusA [Bernardetiaceae bacterium]